MDSPLDILLEEDVVELSEVEVQSFIAEKRFKAEVLNPVVNNGYENSLATRNLKLVKLIVPQGYAHDFSSYNSLSINAENMTEVSFFPIIRRRAFLRR